MSTNSRRSRFIRFLPEPLKTRNSAERPINREKFGKVQTQVLSLLIRIIFTLSHGLHESHLPHLLHDGSGRSYVDRPIYPRLHMQTSIMHVPPPHLLTIALNHFPLPFHRSAYTDWVTRTSNAQTITQRVYEVFIFICWSLFFLSLSVVKTVKSA